MKYYIFLITICLINCKNISKEANANKIEETKTEVIDKEIFKIHVDFTAQKDDIFEVYYTSESVEENFSANKKIRKKIGGSPQSQIVVFELPKDVFPFNFRIDLGQNKEQDFLILHNIKIELNGELISIDQSLIKSFFVMNKFIEYDNGQFNLKEFNGRWDPFIIHKAVLIKKIEIEL